MMVAYHFCFDLSYYRLLRADFNLDPFWLFARATIVSMFLLLAGVSAVLSAREGAGGADGFHAKRFWRRQARIGFCAGLVSAGSYVVFPQTWIFFGILHFIFVASLAGAALVRRALPPWAFLGSGVLAIWVGMQMSSQVFDAAPLQWIGFMTHKPVTEDYVPLFPWVGVYLIGIGAGRMALGRQWVLPLPAAAGHPVWRAGAWLGRHSLVIYMLHQPVMLGIFHLLFAQR